MPPITGFDLMQGFQDKQVLSVKNSKFEHLTEQEHCQIFIEQIQHSDFVSSGKQSNGFHFRSSQFLALDLLRLEVVLITLFTFIIFYLFLKAGLPTAIEACSTLVVLLISATLPWPQLLESAILVQQSYSLSQLESVS